jgi:hypothetical protein
MKRTFQQGIATIYIFTPFDHHHHHYIWVILGVSRFFNGFPGNKFIFDEQTMLTSTLVKTKGTWNERRS